MGESTFIKLEYEAKDKGQRIEIDIVVAAADVERAMEGFYDLMARVKQVGAPAGPERVRRLEGLVGAEVLQEACRDFVLNRFTTEAVRPPSPSDSNTSCAAGQASSCGQNMVLHRSFRDFNSGVRACSPSGCVPSGLKRAIGFSCGV